VTRRLARDVFPEADPPAIPMMTDFFILLQIFLHIFLMLGVGFRIIDRSVPVYIG
jgi:hypothetical protein